MFKGENHCFVLGEDGVLAEREMDELAEPVKKLQGSHNIMLITTETGEVREWNYKKMPISAIIRCLADRSRVYGLKMIRIPSKELFLCKQSGYSKMCMVLGYVTAPALYDQELSAMYDDYIRGNTARLFKAAAGHGGLQDFESFVALIGHAFSIGNPSKAAINGAIKRLRYPDAQNMALYNLLTGHFQRLYPRSSHCEMECGKETLRREAVNRMELLRLSHETVNAFREDGQITISDQYSMGLDPDGDDGLDEIGEKDGIYYTYKGVVWSLYATAPNEETLRLVTEAERQYDALVYHIHRCQVNKDVVLYAFLLVGRNEGEWEHAREMTRMGMPDCAAPVYRHGGFEFSSLPVRCTQGLLLRTN